MLQTSTSSSSVTYTIDLSKYYLLFYCLKYDGSNNLRSGVIAIEKGVVRRVADYYVPYVSVSVSGTTLTASSDKRGNRTDVSLIQLDK